MADPTAEIDSAKPHSARMYDYFLGGNRWRRRALLTSAPEGRTAYIQADLRDPTAILSDRATHGVLLDALPSGSYLVASHLTTEHDPAATAAGQRVMRRAGITMQKRDSDVFAELAFPGLELVPPGIVLVSEWRPDDLGPRPKPDEVNCYGGVGRKI